MTTEQALSTQVDYAGSIRELLEPLEVAILLGASIPAPVGTIGYHVQATGRAHKIDPYTLGYYNTRESAMDALTKWVLNEYRSNTDWATWYDPDLELDWDAQENLFRASYTHEEIVNLYFDTNLNGHYSFEPFAIEHYALEDKFNPALAGTVKLRDYQASYEV